VLTSAEKFLRDEVSTGSGSDRVGETWDIGSRSRVGSHYPVATAPGTDFMGPVAVTSVRTATRELYADALAQKTQLVIASSDGDEAPSKS
jgi:hypothetical protein